MTDSEKAKILLQMLDQASFPGSARKTVLEIAEWLEGIRDKEPSKPTMGIFDESGSQIGH